MKVYHGSYIGIPTPTIKRGRLDTDFGRGFYVATDYDMAEKWSCRKDPPVITEYELDLTGLSVYEFTLDANWLNFVIANRSVAPISFDVNQYDVIIGATADDKLFSTIEQYEMGLISEETAIEVLNCMKVGTQLCLRTEKALQNLQFRTEIHPSHNRILAVREQNLIDRKKAAQLTTEIIRNSHKQSEQYISNEDIDRG